MWEYDNVTVNGEHRQDTVNSMPKNKTYAGDRGLGRGDGGRQPPSGTVGVGHESAHRKCLRAVAGRPPAKGRHRTGSAQMRHTSTFASRHMRWHTTHPSQQHFTRAKNTHTKTHAHNSHTALTLDDEQERHRRQDTHDTKRDTTTTNTTGHRQHKERHNKRRKRAEARRATTTTATQPSTKARQATDDLARMRAGEHSARKKQATHNLQRMPHSERGTK